MKFGAHQLRELFELREGGVLIWRRPSKFHNELIGTPAGCKRQTHSGKWYHIVAINGRAYRRSHIVFCMARGSWPDQQVDHRDGNSLNDNPENLRTATPMQNAWNHKRRKKRSDLPMGVKALESGRFQARIRVNHRCIALGAFDSPPAASAAYQAARAKHFGEFA